MHIPVSIALAATALALSACGNGRGPDGPANRVVNEVPPPPPGQAGPEEPRYGPEQAMAGTWTNRFEHSDFNGCWLDMTEAAAAEIRRRFPTEGPDAPQNGHSYRLQIIGQRQLAPAAGPALFGHMGGWRCAIRAARIVSAEMIGSDHPPARTAPDAAPVNPEVERARKLTGAAPL